MPPVTRRMLTQRHSVSMPPGASGGAQKRSGGPAALHITVARGPFDYAQGRLVPRARRARGKPSRYIGSKARGRARGGQARHGRVNLRSLRSVGVTEGDGKRQTTNNNDQGAILRRFAPQDDSAPAGDAPGSEGARCLSSRRREFTPFEPPAEAGGHVPHRGTCHGREDTRRLPPPARMAGARQVDFGKGGGPSYTYTAMVLDAVDAFGKDGK